MTAATQRRLEDIIDATVRERDCVADSVRSQVAGAVLPYLADVPDAVAGERFATVEEEVLMTRLRQVRAALRAAGVAV